MADLIIGIIVILLVVLALTSMAREKKKGKSLSCGGDCNHCSGHCGEDTKPEDDLKM